MIQQDDWVAWTLSTRARCKCRFGTLPLFFRFLVVVETALELREQPFVGRCHQHGRVLLAAIGRDVPLDAGNDQHVGKLSTSLLDLGKVLRRRGS